MNKLNDNDIPRRISDAHVHFWDLSRMAYPWLDEVPSIKKTFGLDDYQNAAGDAPIRNLVFVQCECLPEQYQTEVDYVSELAEVDPRIRAIVAYFPLEAADAADKLQDLVANPLVRGIRRLEEAPVSCYANPAFVANMDLLNGHGLSFDLGVKAEQLPAAVELCHAKPDNRYMLDHFGKPAIRAGELAKWKRHIAELAQNPNIYCKLSGLVTEADWQHWTIDDLQPYVDFVLERFGTSRVAFGGDWPVVTLASSYRRWLDTALQLCHALPAAELDKVFYQNTLDFYSIDDNA